MASRATKDIPMFSTAYLALALIVAFLSGRYMIFSDCDETFNYWEPLHFLVYGHGMQAWEYSPKYGLRSYAYLAMYALPMRILSLVINNKIAVLKFSRVAIGIASVICQYKFVDIISMRISPNIACYLAAVLCTSSGLFISSTCTVCCSIIVYAIAILPNAFSMNLAFLTWAYWIDAKWNRALMLLGFSAICGWPYAAFTGLPMILTRWTYESRNTGPQLKLGMDLWRVLISGLFISTYILAPTMIVDFYYYGKWTIPSFHAILYNVISDAGPALYGVAPWNYYLLNLLLNFGPFFPPALLAGPIFLWRSRRQKRLDTRATFALVLMFMWYLWLALFSKQPHKEERFMFPVYPLIAFAAAYSISSIHELVSFYMPHAIGKPVTRVLVALVLLSGGLVCMARSAALVKFYSAPQYVFEELQSAPQVKSPSEIVCMGASWYRFPTHFYLAANQRLAFVKSDFGGILPRQFGEQADATVRIPEGLNAYNREERGQYTLLRSCDYFAGTSPTNGTTPADPLPVDNWDDGDWTMVLCRKMIDSDLTPRISRLIWLPWISTKYVVYQEFCVWKRIK